MKSRIVLIAFALAVLISLASCGIAPASAPSAAIRSIIVVGEGTATAKPDIARANIGVETTAATVADASKQNNDRMAAVIAKLKLLGVADKDIQTSNYSISSERVQSRTGSDTTIYRASNTVAITVRDLDKVGTILDQVVQAGANQVYSVSFSIENTTKLQGDARVKAMADAQARADDFAKLSGVTRGEILSLSEVIGVSGPIPVSERALGLGGAAPIESGTLQVQARVQVTYAIR